VEERLQELVAEGAIRIETRGRRVGQVKSLEVLDLGDYRFGLRSRVTARVSMGRGTVESIEREIELSGPIHSKGFLILTGYLAVRVCRARGLTGHQGVAISAANVANLMLSDEVVRAVKESRFHVRAVRTIDEGIELLTGRPAGERQEDGTYPSNTVHRLVHDHLRRYAERLTALAQPDGRPSLGDQHHAAGRTAGRRAGS